jgi:hypothetical protein
MQENTLLRRQLKYLNSRRSIMQRRIAEMETENGKLRKRLSEMDVFLKEKNLTLAEGAAGKTEAAAPEEGRESAPERAESVELPPIIVRPPSEAPPEPGQALVGKVLAVNRDHNFVVIDLGEDAGLRVGDTFRVYRDSKVVANIQIIQARKTISACDIRKETVPVKVGDIVK